MKKKLFGILPSYVMIKKILLLSICSFCLFGFSAPSPLQAFAITLTSATRALYAHVWAEDVINRILYEDTATDTSSAYGVYNGKVVAIALGVIREVQQNTTLNTTDTSLEAYGSMWSDIPEYAWWGWGYRSSLMKLQNPLKAAGESGGRQHPAVN